MNQPVSRRQFLLSSAGAAAAAMIPGRLWAAGPDGWQFDPGNPIIRPGQLNPPYDSRVAGAPCILPLGDTLRMYYWGQGLDGFYSICMAEAGVSDVNHWKGLGAVLHRQADNPHNNRGPAAPMVVPVTADRWLMYIVAKGAIIKPPFYNDVILGAESTDAGRSWRYVSPEPMIARDRPYDQNGTASLYVICEGGKFRMWYTGFHYRLVSEAKWMTQVVHGRLGDYIPYLGLAYAESKDGLSWTKPIPHLVVPPREDRISPVECRVAKPWIIRAGPQDYRMWASCIAGKNYKIYALRSRDGIAWNWDRAGDHPDLDDGRGVEPGIGPKGTFDDAMREYACFVRIGNELHGWYTGNDYGGTGTGHATRRWET